MIVSKLCARAPRLMLVTPKSNFMSRARRGIKKEPNRVVIERAAEAPSTEPFDKVNYYGRIIVGVAAAGGLGLLCSYSVPRPGSTSAPALFDEAAIWPQFVKQRIQKTYMYFAGGAAVAAAAGLQSVRMPRTINFFMRGGLMPVVASLGLIIGSGLVMRALPYTEHLSAKHVAWAVHSASFGVVLGPMLLMAGPVLAGRAALYTLGVVGGLSTLACVAPSDKFLLYRGPLAIGLGCVAVASIGSCFLSPFSAFGAGVYGVALYGGLVVSSGLLLFNTQALVHDAKYRPEDAEHLGIHPYDPINRSSLLLTDSINIFIRILMIMSGGRRK